MPSHSSRALISIIVPCCNEQDLIEQTHERIAAAMSRVNCDLQFIYVNDGSRDATGILLETLHERDPRVCVIDFARNFGHQMAVTAGINHAAGDAVVIIDADLQDPPEVIPQMIELWRHGYQVVHGQRTERPGEPAWRMAAIGAFYRFIRWCSDTPMTINSGDFRLLDRQVVEALQRMPERDRYLRGMVSWAGFRQVALPYRRAQRLAGVSKYPLAKLVKLAADGVLSFSMAPLRLATWLGIITLVATLLGGAGMCAAAVFGGAAFSGTTWLALAISLFAGAQLSCLGILGEYVGRIYREIKGRPLYLVSRTLPSRETAQQTVVRAA